MTIDKAIAAIPSSDAMLCQVGRNVAASLPVTSLDKAHEPISVVSGAGDWSDHIATALANGARGIILDCPTPLPADPMATIAPLLHAHDARLVVRPLWSGHVSVAEGRALFDTVEQPVMIDILIDGQAPFARSQILLGALQMVEALVGAVQWIAVDHADKAGFILRGGVGADNIFLSILGRPSIDSAPSAELTLLGTDRLASLSATFGRNWTPVHMMLADREGERTLARSYESPDRTAYKRLLADLGSSASALADLTQIERLSALLIQARID